MEGYKHEHITRKIIGIAFQVHSEIGPGLPEKIYQNALIYGLREDGLLVESEKSIRVLYKNHFVGTFRMDLLVDNCVIVELKAVTGELPKIFQMQTITYLKASNIEVGLLINFGNKSLEIKRFANYTNFSK